MHYAFAIGISKYDPEKEMAIIEAIRKGWNVTEWKTQKRETVDVLIGSGLEEMDTTMESDCAEATASAVWEANDGFCEVEVYLKPLDPPPPRQYNLGEEAYRNMVVRAMASPDD